MPSGPNPDVRRVLVVISDGDDNSSAVRAANPWKWPSARA